MCRVVLLGLFILVTLFFVGDARFVDMPAKRRMVIRVPFMKNPDNEHLSRIFNKMAFAEQKQKKLAAFLDDML